jgi:hypothetical protein
LCALSTYRTVPSPLKRKYEVLSLKQTYLNYISKQKSTPQRKCRMLLSYSVFRISL